MSHFVSQFSSAIEQVLPMVEATYKDIHLLFVAVGTQQWGKFDPANLRVRKHEAYLPGNENPLDRAANRS